MRGQILARQGRGAARARRGGGARGDSGARGVAPGDDRNRDGRDRTGGVVGIPGVVEAGSGTINLATNVPGSRSAPSTRSSPSCLPAGDARRTTSTSRARASGRRESRARRGRLRLPVDRHRLRRRARPRGERVAGAGGLRRRSARRTARGAVSRAVRPASRSAIPTATADPDPRRLRSREHVVLAAKPAWPGAARARGRARRRSRCRSTGRRSRPRRARFLRPLAERGEVDVVLERHRHGKQLGELRVEGALLEPGDVRREVDRARAGLDDARDADDNPSIASVAVPVVTRSDARSAAIASEPPPPRRARAAPRPGAREICPAGPLIAPRRNRVPRSKPRTSAASGTGSKVDGAVAGAAGIVRRLADELRLEERLERERHRRLRIPARREISAREIGAPARIASSTGARSGSLSSGGSARLMSGTLTDSLGCSSLTSSEARRTVASGSET